MTKQGVKILLAKAYKEGKLPYEDFKSVTCIKIQGLEQKGAETIQLFLINSSCTKKTSSYILKKMHGKYNEAKNLAKFFELKQLDDLIWPNHVKGYQTLAK